MRHTSKLPESGGDRDYFTTEISMNIRERPSPPRHPGGKTRRVKLGNRIALSEGLNQPVMDDLFHFFMTVTWPQLFATFAVFFLSFDLLFGCVYYLVPGCIANLSPPGFAGAFFFSVETLATVGYGDMHPQTLYGHSVAMVEIFIGLMMLALITGIMFARFSRPRARFLFSACGIVRPIDGRLTLVFRAANQRQNIVQDASAQLRLLRDEVSQEGLRIRRITDLSLTRSQHPMFSIGWTIMHIIDATSPLHGETALSLRQAEAYFILSLSGTDETTGQVLMARAEYPSSAVRWNAAFKDILETDSEGTLHIHYSRFDEIEELPPR
jgi:inward rectifier potassium channel